ncbi:MAG: DegT/DnrJ/EryC1/StrS family aminotransferase [Chloroflexota bacterium]
MQPTPNFRLRPRKQNSPPNWRQGKLISSAAIVAYYELRTTPLRLRESSCPFVEDKVRPPANREAVMRALAGRGIPSRPYFIPIHLQPFYAKRFGYKRGDFPVTESLGDVSLALPFSGVMSEEQVDYVVGTVKEAVVHSHKWPFRRMTGVRVKLTAPRRDW